ncbi:MAG: hypothetical protein QM765_51985 [Myxococcales bacterium]
MSTMRSGLALLAAAGGLAACFTPTTEVRFELPDGGGAGRRDGGCQPRCTGRECGDDGCGGRCGTCPQATGCAGGQCRPCPNSLLCEGTCCDVDQACVDRVCVTCGCKEGACGLDSCGRPCGACPWSTVCSTTTWRCVKQDLCANVDCSPGTVCDPADGACRCSATSCPSGQICDLVTGSCRTQDCAQVCSAEMPCQPDTGTCRCTPTTCQAGRRCDPGSGRCVEQACWPACGGETPVCDLSTLTCRCNATSCPSGQVCDAVTGRCVADTCWPPCGGERPYCVPGVWTCSCTATSCAGGWRCDLVSGVCVEQACSPACGGEAPVCDVTNNRCLCTPGSCAVGRRCVNGSCQGAGCSPACSGETPECDASTMTCKCNLVSCPAGMFCDPQGACRPSAPCDPAWQLGCAPGEGCYLDAASGSYRCVNAGSSPVGTPCSRGEECRAGADCLGSGGTRTCVEYCDPETSVGCVVNDTCNATASHLGVCGACPADRLCGLCCPSGLACVSGACMGGESCSPLATNDCLAGQGCYNATFQWDCFAAGALAEGAACEKSEECIPGLGCFYAGGVKQCRRLCSVGSGAECAGGQACMTLGMYEVGICVPCPSPCGNQCCRPGQVCQAGACAMSSSTCDPGRAGECPQGQACYFDYGMGNYQCLEAGTRPLNASCFFDFECQAGMGCLGPLFNVCLPYCSPSLPACATGRDCVDLGDGSGWCG